MKQMKKNSKAIDFGLTRFILRLSGLLSVGSNEDGLVNVDRPPVLYFQPDSNVRALSVKGDADTTEVSSMSTNPEKLNNLAAMLKETLGQSCNKQLLALISPNEDNTPQLVHLKKVKVVERNGNMVLRMVVSLKDFEAKGQYARDSTDSDILDGTVSITCFGDPCA